MRSHGERSGGAVTSAGYTLVELVAVILILGVIGFVTSHVIMESTKVYARTVPAMEAAYQARLSAQLMQREIRDMKDTASITAFTATALTFVDNSDTTIAYSLSGSDLLRNGDLLAQGVTSLSFTYWKTDGTTALLAADLHLAEFDLTVQTGNEPYRIRTAAFPRVLSP